MRKIAIALALLMIIGFAVPVSADSGVTVARTAATQKTSASAEQIEFPKGEYGFWVTEDGTERFYQQASRLSGESWRTTTICVDSDDLPYYSWVFHEGMQSTGDSFTKQEGKSIKYDDSPVYIKKKLELVDGKTKIGLRSDYGWTCTITKYDGETLEGTLEGTLDGKISGKFRFLADDPTGILNSSEAKMVWDRFWGNYEDTSSQDTSTQENADNGTATSKSKNKRDCGVCGGTGKCQTCSGKGTLKCTSCSTGKCRACNGKGGKVRNGKWSECIVCWGSGKCSTCNGTKKMTCSICNGYKKCHACGGNGKSKIS